MTKITRGYNVWSAEEENALRDGVKKHGLGAWEVIRKDPEFVVLEGRTGVQLKDKFRNLVKFRHITAEESKTLKPKGSGPWSRKYSASSLSRERSLTRTPSAGRLPSPEQPEAEEKVQEHAQVLLALESGKDPTSIPSIGEVKARSRLRAPSQDELETETEDGDEQGISSGRSGQAAMRRKRRRSLENRRFGIYDQRRYCSDGTLMDLDELDLLEGVDGDGRRSMRMGRGRRRRREEDDTETETEEEDDEPIPDEDDEEEGLEGMQGGDDDEDEEYIVRCQGCGTKHDDGQAMIECEVCKVWAHIDCLKKQVASDPATFQFDFEHYVCFGCQRKRSGAPPLAFPGLPPLSGSGLMMTGADAAGAWGHDRNGSHSGLSAHTRMGPGMTSGFAAEAGGDTKPNKDDLSNLLLGLANGSGTSRKGSLEGEGWQGSRRSSGRLTGRRGSAAEELPAWGGPPRSSSLRPNGSLPGAEDVFDSLTTFLTNRSGSALGHRAASPKLQGSPGLGKRSNSGALAAPRPQRTGSHSNMEDLLTSQGQAANAATALLNARSGSGSDGRNSPSLIAALKRAGSTQPLALPPLQYGGAGPSGLGRPPSRGPLGDLMDSAHHLFDLHDEAHNGPMTQMALDALKGDNALITSILGNRAPTPSQLFIDSLLRGATPDIGIAPLVQGVLGGNAEAAAAAAAATAAANAAATQTVLAAAAAAAAQLSGLAGTLPAPIAPGTEAAVAAMMAAAGAAAAGAPAPALQPEGAAGAGPSSEAAAAAAAAAGTSAEAAAAAEEKKLAHHQLHLSLNEELARLASAGLAAGLTLPPLDLRPGTPDPWALLRAVTPTPDALALAGFPSLGAADWLLNRSTPPLPPLAEMLEAANKAGIDGNTAVANLVAAVAGAAGPSVNGMSPLVAAALQGTKVQPEVTAAEAAAAAAVAEAAAAAAAASAAAMSGPGAGAGAASGTLNATGAAGVLQGLHERKGSTAEDLGFNIEDMLRSNTPALK